MVFFASREDDNDLSDDEANRLNFQVAPNRDSELRAMQQTIIEAHDGWCRSFTFQLFVLCDHLNLFVLRK